MARKVKINLSELVDTFENGFDELDYYLDVETGEIVLVTEGDQSALREFEEEVEIAEDEDVDAKFEEWLDECGYPGWQLDSIRGAFQVEGGFGSRFIEIPEQDSHQGYDDMADFAETVENAKLRNRLAYALNGSKPFRRFKDALGDDPDEEKRWFAFSRERTTERVLEWLEDEGIEIEPTEQA